MIFYVVSLLPLVECLNSAVPEAVTSMFADDAAVVASFHDCTMCLEFLAEEGPKYGYYPEPEKTHDICKLEDEPEAKAAFLLQGIAISCSRGERYLGGFVGCRIEREYNGS
ncbi:hypothetical protein ACHAXN_001656 [Cyclotella atomus]